MKTDTPGRTHIQRLVQRKKFREHRELLNLCAHTEVCFIDRERFLQSLEHLSPSRAGFCNLLLLSLQIFLFAWAFQTRTFSGHIHMEMTGKQKKLGEFLCPFGQVSRVRLWRFQLDIRLDNFVCHSSHPLRLDLKGGMVC